MPASGAFGDLAASHAAWWGAFWNASAVYLGDGNQLLEGFWYGMQYLLGSTARSGKVAPGLWGVWTVVDAPNWNGGEVTAGDLVCRTLSITMLCGL